jgi:DNA modification methylase
MSEEMRVRLYCKDCQVALKELRAKSVDLIITDPP